MVKTIGFAFIVVAIIPIIISIFSERKSFFNIKSIIKDHLKIFENCKSHYLIFYGFPFILSVGLALIYDAQNDFYNNLSVIISIILSMLFAVLAILISFNYFNSLNSNEEFTDQQVNQHNTSNSSNIIKVVNETTNFIIFETIICVFLLIYGMIVVIVRGVMPLNLLINKIFTGVSCFFFTVLILDLLVVIKRMSRIIKIKINERNHS